MPDPWGTSGGLPLVIRWLYSTGVLSGHLLPLLPVPSRSSCFPRHLCSSTGNLCGRELGVVGRGRGVLWANGGPWSHGSLTQTPAKAQRASLTGWMSQLNPGALSAITLKDRFPGDFRGKTRNWPNRRLLILARNASCFIPYINLRIQG